MPRILKCFCLPAAWPGWLRGLLKTTGMVTLLVVYLGVALHVEAMLFGGWIATGAPVSAAEAPCCAKRCPCCKSKSVCHCHHEGAHPGSGQGQALPERLADRALDGVLSLPAGEDFEIPCATAGPCGNDQPRTALGGSSKIEHLAGARTARVEAQSLPAAAAQRRAIRDEQPDSRATQPADKVPIRRALSI